MEENNKKKKKKLPLIITCIVAVFVVAFVGLCVTGILPVPTEYGVVSLDTAMLLDKADDVQDEATLRELLLMDQELEITVTKDIELSDTLEVVNTKTLKGDAKLSYNITGLFAQGSVLEVQKNAHLIMDGLVLSGEGMADAIKVNQKAELTYKSGTIEYVRYGITTNGKVTVEDITVKHVATAAIFANFRSDVVVNKGYFYNSYSTTLQIENGGSMEIYEGVVIEQSGGTAINNIGDLLVYGCTIKDTVGSGINNEGNMTIEYKGSKADGMIEMENIGKIALRIDSSDDTSIKDVHVNGTGTNGVFITDKVTKGSLTLSDSVFENTGDESGNTFSIAGNATIKDVTIRGSLKGSFYVREKAKVNVSGLTIENCTGNAMSISGELIADGITINGATGHGIDIARATDKTFGKATLENITISGVEKNNLLVRAGSVMEIKDSVIGKSTRTSVYVSAEANMTLENVELQGVVDEGLWVIVAAESAKVTIKGDTTITGGTRGGICVEKNATCTMESGTISGINSTGDGAAVYLRGEGSVFNFLGGTFTNNIAKKAGGAVYIGKDATFNMSGGTITRNKATNRGGAVYCMGNMNFTGGTISGNESSVSANGILCKGNVVVSGSAYMAKDDIGVDSADTPVIVKGSTLKKHSASEPLLITANRDTKPGTRIVACDSNNAAVALVANHVASGTRAYSLYQVEKGLAVNANKADMDMTGADTVSVSTFAEFKEAVESTKTKRYVIVTADIAFESEVFVPLGATVYIRDDGKARTLSRKDDMGSNLISTSYGTGLYLVGTAEGKLVIDGTTSAAKKADQIDPAVRVYGGTEIKNVAFKNNLTSEKGAFVRQDYGDIAIYSSTFTGGKTTDHGGALYFETGSAIVENCVFENNNATKEGGAIRAQNNKDLVLTIKTSEFKNNTADSHGGAISSGAGTVAVTSSNFTNNTTKTGHAGAVSVVNAVSAKIDGTGTFKGNSAVDGGAVYTNNSIISVNGYTFDSNKAEIGGAIEINNGTNNGSDPVGISNVVFTNNAATDKGGAIYNTGRTTNVENCTFESNTAKGHGGAVYIAGGGTLNFAGSDATKAIFESNTAGSNGGAVYVAKNGTLTADGYAFNGNSATGGGAVNMTNDSKKATITNTTFSANTANGQGGAIRVDGNEDTIAVLTIKDTTFTDHTANASGGAIYTKAETHIENASFTGNSGSVGGALNVCGGKEFTATSCTFTSNKSTRDDVSDVEGGGAVIISGGKSTFDGTGSFTSNNTSQYGGAIFAKNDAVVTIKGYTFTSNTAVTTTTGTVDGKDTTVKGYGGAIYATGSNVTITDSKFESNNSVERGGAIYSAGGGTLTLIGTDETKAIFSTNSSTGHNGGAIAIGSGTLNVTGYVFDGNEGKYGGAIALNNNANITGTLKTSIFTSNVATTGDGGAIYVSSVKADGKQLAVEDCKFEANTATNGRGGAIYIAGATPVTVTGTTEDALFSRNIAKNGGAIYIDKGFESEDDNSKPVTVSGYIFKNNQVTEAGGAIYNGGTLNVTGSTFDTNIAQTYGGAINSAKTLVVDNTKFVGNKATNNRGGAIYGASGGKVTLKAETGKDMALIQNNSSGDGGGAICIGSGDLAVTGYTFDQNETKNFGGAIRCNNNASIDVDLTNCIFTSNKTTNISGTKGGAILYDNGTANSGRHFNVTNCKFDGNSSAEGGALYINKGATTIFTGTDANMAILSNNTATTGGAIYLNGTNMTVTGYAFTNNTAALGGAIECYGATFTATDCTFTGNSSTTNSTDSKVGRGGGAVNLVADSTGTFNVTENGTGMFKNNSAVQWGGAIYTTDSKMTISGYTFEGNSAMYAGAILIDNATENTLDTDAINISNATLKKNSSTKDGGAMYINTRTVNITNCVYGGVEEDNSSLGNSARGVAGAICLNGGATLNVSGTTFTKNSSGGQGGALWLANKTAATITGCTFELQTAGASAGALYTKATLTMSDTTFRNNTAATAGGAINCSGGTFVATSCNFDNNTSVGGSEGGGAISITGGSNATFKGTGSFSNNKANNTTAGGGAIYANNSTVSITGYTFNKNTAAKYGGAIYYGKNTKVTFTLKSCVFGTGDSANSPYDIYKGKGTLNADSTNSSFTTN